MLLLSSMGLEGYRLSGQHSQKILLEVSERSPVYNPRAQFSASGKCQLGLQAC